MILFNDRLKRLEQSAIAYIKEKIDASDEEFTEVEIFQNTDNYHVLLITKEYRVLEDDITDDSDYPLEKYQVDILCEIADYLHLKHTNELPNSNG